MGKILSYAARAYEQALTSPNHEMVDHLPGVFALAGKDGDRVGKYPDGLRVGLRRPIEEIRARARKQWGVYQADISRRMVDMQARRLTDKGLGYNKPMTATQLEERALHQFLLSRGVAPKSPHTAEQLEQITQEHEFSAAGRLPNWEWHLLYGPPNLAGLRAALEYVLQEMTQAPEAAIGTGVAQLAGASLEDSIAWGRGVQALFAPVAGTLGGLIARGRHARQAIALDQPSARAIEPITRGTLAPAVDPSHRLTIGNAPESPTPETAGPAPAPTLSPEVASAPVSLLKIVPPVLRAPPPDIRGRARQRALDFRARFPKVAERSIDALAEMFGYTGGWTREGRAQHIHKIRATTTEQATIIAYHQRPTVVRIEALRPAGTVTPDLRIHYMDGTSEVVEVRTATGAGARERAVFRERPSAGTQYPLKAMPSANAPTIDVFVQAIGAKLRGGQLVSPGALVIGATFETTIEMVSEAMARQRVAALGNLNVNRVEFHVRAGSDRVLQVTFSRSSGFQIPDVRPLLGVE